MSNKPPPHITRAEHLLDTVRERFRSLTSQTGASDTTVAEILGNLEELRGLLRAFPDGSRVGSVLKEISVELVCALLREIGRSSNCNYPRFPRTGIRWLVLARPFETLEKRAA